MTAVTRTLNAGTETAIARQHTQPYHICELVLPTSGTKYLSEGPALVFNSGGGNQTYLEGRVKVGQLKWEESGEQTLSLEVLDDANHDAYAWFLANKISNATIRVWIVYREANGTSNTPVLYAVGSCDASELSPDGMRITVITTNSERKFFPNTYIGSIGSTHLPQERAVVFWNNTTYVLEREFE